MADERKKINMLDLGKDVKLVREFIRSQIYVIGQEFSPAAASTQDFNCKLGGKVRWLHGINLFLPQINLGDEDKFSLTVNNEVLIDKTIWWAYTPGGALFANIRSGDDYFKLPRPMSGNDTVTLNYQSVNAHKIYINFYCSELLM